MYSKFELGGKVYYKYNILLDSPVHYVLKDDKFLVNMFEVLLNSNDEILNIKLLDVYKLNSAYTGKFEKIQTTHNQFLAKKLGQDEVFLSIVKDAVNKKRGLNAI